MLRSSAIICATRHHGETAVIARLLTPEHGMVAAYVAGGRGRVLRPVLIPGNMVEAELREKPGSQLPFARVELKHSRGPWLTEALASAAMAWACGLSAQVLPERQPYPSLYLAMEALLDAICHAPSARGWMQAMMAYEALILRELGYGAAVGGATGAAGVAPFRENGAPWAEMLSLFDRLGEKLMYYLLAGRRSDVMAARTILRDRLARIV